MAAAFDLDAGLNQTIKRCVNDEQQAKDKLLNGRNLRH